MANTKAQIKLNELFFNTPFVKYEQNFEGQKVLDDGTIIVGNKAGPSNYNTIKNTCHELAHLVEIDDKRMRCHGWGLKVPEVWVYNRMCQEPTTNQITLRELRVMAYQSNLLDYIGASYNLDSLIKPLQHLQDTCFIPLEDGSSAYGDEKAHSLDYNEIKASQQRWRVNQVIRMRSEYTIERFMSEWNRKMEWLSNSQYIIDESNVLRN